MVTFTYTSTPLVSFPSLQRRPILIIRTCVADYSGGDLGARVQLVYGRLSRWRICSIIRHGVGGVVQPLLYVTEGLRRTKDHPLVGAHILHLRVSKPRARRTPRMFLCCLARSRICSATLLRSQCYLEPSETKCQPYSQRGDPSPIRYPMMNDETCDENRDGGFVSDLLIHNQTQTSRLPPTGAGFPCDRDSALAIHHARQ